MLMTFAVEILLAAYVLIRHRVTRFGQAAGATLLMLALFQFAEYRICTGPEENALLWSRVGFVAITLLPVMGLYLVAVLSRRQHFMKLAYLSAAAFVVYFLFSPKALTGAICGGNYVVFNSSSDFYRLYGIYYLGFLLLGVWEILDKLHDLKRRTKTRKALQWLIAGYVSFMAPMAMAYALFPETRSAVASVMCGFAIGLALILSLKIVPLYTRMHRQNVEPAT